MKYAFLILFHVKQRGEMFHVKHQIASMGVKFHVKHF